MKNWEKYEKEISEIGVPNIAVLKNIGEIVGCFDVDCESCLFKTPLSCNKEKTKWLYSEYHEPVVLTEDERKLCELLGYGWIARDKKGGLFRYEKKPVKDVVAEMWFDRSYIDALNIEDIFPQCKFEFIKWEDREDQEPWEITI